MKIIAFMCFQEVKEPKPGEFTSPGMIGPDRCWLKPGQLSMEVVVPFLAKFVSEQGDANKTRVARVKVMRDGKELSEDGFEFDTTEAKRNPLVRLDAILEPESPGTFSFVLSADDCKETAEWPFFVFQALR